MPKVSKTGAKEEDKVEGSQTKIKEVQSGPCSPSAKPATDLQCGAGEGSWSGVPTGVCSGAGFPSSYAHLLGEEHPGRGRLCRSLNPSPWGERGHPEPWEATAVVCGRIAPRGQWGKARLPCPPAPSGPPSYAFPKAKGNYESQRCGGVGVKL